MAGKSNIRVSRDWKEIHKDFSKTEERKGILSAPDSDGWIKCVRKSKHVISSTKSPSNNIGKVVGYDPSISANSPSEPSGTKKDVKIVFYQPLENRKSLKKETLPVMNPEEFSSTEDLKNNSETQHKINLDLRGIRDRSPVSVESTLSRYESQPVEHSDRSPPLEANVQRKKKKKENLKPSGTTSHQVSIHEGDVTSVQRPNMLGKHWEGRDPYSITSFRELLAVILQMDNREDFLDIDLDSNPYDLLIDDEGDPNKTNKIDFFKQNAFYDDFVIMFDSAEGKRRVVSWVNQLTQRRMQEEWRKNQTKFPLSVRKIAEKLKIEEDFPVFYDARVKDFREVYHEVKFMDKKKPKNMEKLRKGFQDGIHEYRLATMWVLAQFNESGRKKLFTEPELKKFSKLGVSIPQMMYIAYVLQLDQAVVRWNLLTKKELEGKAISFMSATKGYIEFADAEARWTGLSIIAWLFAPGREILAQHPIYGPRLNSRLKALATTEALQEGDVIKPLVSLSIGESLIGSHFNIFHNELILLKTACLDDNMLWPKKSCTRKKKKQIIFPERTQPSFNTFMKEKYKVLCNFWGYTVAEYNDVHPEKSILG